MMTNSNKFVRIALLLSAVVLIAAPPDKAKKCPTKQPDTGQDKEDCRKEDYFCRYGQKDCCDGLYCSARSHTTGHCQKCRYQYESCGNDKDVACCAGDDPMYCSEYGRCIKFPENCAKNGDKCDKASDCCGRACDNATHKCEQCIKNHQPCDTNDKPSKCCRGYCDSGACLCKDLSDADQCCDPKIPNYCCLGKCLEAIGHDKCSHICGCDSSAEDCEGGICVDTDLGYGVNRCI